MSKQIIKENGKPAFVVIPWKEWQRIESVLEDRADSEAVRAFLENPEKGFPEDVVHALAIERGRRSPGRTLLAGLGRALDIDADLLTTA